MDPRGLLVNVPAPVPPPPIDVVVVPESFAVSSLVGLARCPLSVLGVASVEGARASAALPPHPLALLGSILHHARAEVLEGRWGGAVDAIDAFRSVLDAAIASAEQQLRDEAQCANLVPLRDSVGRRAWTRRIGQAERWAAGVAGVVSRREPPRPLARLLGVVGSVGATSPTTRVGAEQRLDDPGLRLRGRPDWTEQHGSSSLIVSEFKTGSVVDADGRLVEEHILQVQAYALMLERARPGLRVEPYLEGAGRIPVPWGEPQRAHLMERLRELDQRLPAGRGFAAETLASPGTHCGFCRLRPMCSRYLHDAPQWWPERAGALRPLPLDVWGVVDHVEQGEVGVSVRLVDLSGRRVLVDGLSEDVGLREVQSGDSVWFFDLESSEDLDQHGAKVQPRNFHQRPPGPRWSSARRLRVFHRPAERFGAAG